MAGHHQGGAVPTEAPASQYHSVPGLLPEGAHGLGELALCLWLNLCPYSGPSLSWSSLLGGLWSIHSLCTWRQCKQENIEYLLIIQSKKKNYLILYIWGFPETNEKETFVIKNQIKKSTLQYLSSTFRIETKGYTLLNSIIFHTTKKKLNWVSMFKKSTKLLEKKRKKLKEFNRNIQFYLE